MAVSVLCIEDLVQKLSFASPREMDVLASKFTVGFFVSLLLSCPNGRAFFVLEQSLLLSCPCVFSLGIFVHLAGPLRPTPLIL